MKLLAALMEGKVMSAFENSRKFFDACEAAVDWEGCKEYVAAGASFIAQNEPLESI